MGNAGSASLTRERHKSSDISTPNSPFRELPAAGVGVLVNTVGGGGVHQPNVSGGGGGGVGQAFHFDKSQDARLVLQGGSSQEDEEPYYTKPVTLLDQNDPEFSEPVPRQRSSTISEGTSATMSEAENIDENMKQALPTVLRWDGGGRNVLISGTFSNWKALPMVKSHGNFVTIIDLPEGDHQYKFCVDGEWKHDPKMKSIDNDAGTKNNLVSVRQSDFEVFQALAKDSENVPNYAEKEYSQDVPQVKPWEKISGPPVLPPHLLQVILNKDTPLSCEPTLLPEPNHVMLNHLYALSIKDGVMVLSATHRYRKKYVTTLLYKPI